MDTLDAFDAYIFHHRKPVSTKSNLVYCVIRGSEVVAIYLDYSDAYNLLLEMCHLFPELYYSISCCDLRLRPDQSLTGV